MLNRHRSALGTQARIDLGLTYGCRSCAAFEPLLQVEGDSLPRQPIDGHTASRSLDVHRWTICLDTGRVRGIVPSLSPFLMSRVQIYGRRITALMRRYTVTPGKSRGAIEARAYKSRE